MIPQPHLNIARKNKVIIPTLHTIPAIANLTIIRLPPDYVPTNHQTSLPASLDDMVTELEFWRGYLHEHHNDQTPLNLNLEFKNIYNDNRGHSHLVTVGFNPFIEIGDPRPMGTNNQ